MNKMLDLWNYLTLQLTMSITTKIQLNLTVANRFFEVFYRNSFGYYSDDVVKKQ